MEYFLTPTYTVIIPSLVKSPSDASEAEYFTTLRVSSAAETDKPLTKICLPKLKDILQ